MGSGSAGTWWLATPMMWYSFDYTRMDFVNRSGERYSNPGSSPQFAVAFGSGSAGEWWLRAPAFRDSGQDRFVESFFDVTTSGKYSSSYRASVALKVAFGFCIRRFLNL